MRLCAITSKVYATHLAEADLLRLFTEALTADVQAVLADDTTLVGADAANSRIRGSARCEAGLQGLAEVLARYFASPVLLVHARIIRWLASPQCPSDGCILCPRGTVFEPSRDFPYSSPQPTSSTDLSILNLVEE